VKAETLILYFSWYLFSSWCDTSVSRWVFAI